MRTSPVRVVTLLGLGVALGPGGLSILSPRILPYLDPAAPVAVAVLGVAAALALPRTRGALTHPAVHAATTGLVLAVALLAARPTAAAVIDGAASWPVMAVLLAIAAATSAPAPSLDDDPGGDRTQEHDYVLPIIAGGVLLALLREPSLAHAVWLAIEISLIAAVISAAGWLLVSRAATAGEQRVFTFACLLLLGGVADYLSLSALLTGFAAGICWRAAGGGVAESIARDVAYVEQTLVAFILVLAGAHGSFSAPTLLLAAAFVFVRALGKIAGAWLARLAPGEPYRVSVATLLSPGVFGIAFALNGFRAAGADLAPALGVVAVGAAASALLALAVGGTPEAA